MAAAAGKPSWMRHNSAPSRHGNDSHPAWDTAFSAEGGRAVPALICVVAVIFAWAISTSQTAVAQGATNIMTAITGFLNGYNDAATSHRQPAPPSAFYSGNELTNEIERGATQIWNQQKVHLDSELKGILKQIDIWKTKAQTLAANNKESKNVGLYGDPKALSKEPLKPTEVALATQRELETAVQVKTEQLEGIREQRQNNSDAWSLYRDEVHAVVAVNSLNGMLHNAEQDFILSKLIELYFEMRLRIASSVSGDLYSSELTNAKTAVAQIWKVYQKARPASSKMMDFFLSY
jgi:hypothetical protein